MWQLWGVAKYTQMWGPAGRTVQAAGAAAPTKRRYAITCLQQAIGMLHVLCIVCVCILYTTSSTIVYDVCIYCVGILCMYTVCILCVCILCMYAV